MQAVHVRRAQPEYAVCETAGKALPLCGVGHGCCLIVDAERRGTAPPPVPTRQSQSVPSNHIEGDLMNWTTPAYTDLRLGFEITMYIANR
ncbi:coenzyme PQQ biosynthesis protein A [Cupriavidus gilardii CR3]|nr:coenzyme PQQ biosynthesis protein A [Cupriavidus gilardii CR3]